MRITQCPYLSRTIAIGMPSAAERKFDLLLKEV
jgi:hypothetical protein